MHLDWAGSQNKPQQHESPLGSHVHHWLLHPHRQKDVLGDAGVWHEHDGEEEHWDDFISINCFADCVNSQPWGHVLESPNAYWQAQRHCWEVCMQVAVDEGMIKYFGPHTLKQFMQGKPTRFENKIWILATSDSQLLACQQLFVSRWPTILQNNLKGAARIIFWPRDFGGRTAPNYDQKWQKRGWKKFSICF